MPEIAKSSFLFKLTCVLISVIAIGYLANVGKFIFAPLFFALLLSLLFLPFANFLERKLRFSRSISTLFSVLVMVVVLGAVVLLFSSQISHLSSDWPQLQKQVIKSFGDLQTWVSHTFNIKFSKQLKYLDDAGQKLISSSTVILGTTIAVFSSSLAFAAFSVLFFIFILNYRRVLYTFITNVFEEKHKPKVEEISIEIQKIIKKYITGLFIQIFIVSSLTTLVLTILNVKYALLLGVFTGILNVIPYVGIFISALLASFLSFALGGTSKFLFVILGYLGVHLIDGNIILPFVVGSKVKINALFSFLIILIGESLWGISGMFLGIPFLAMVKIICDRIDELKPWGALLGEGKKRIRPKRRLKLSKKITLEEKD